MNLRFLTQIAAVATLLALAACAPISRDFVEGGGLPAAGGTLPTAGGTVPVVAATPEGLAVATVTTPSLRVRSLPSATGALIGALASGETYGVLSRSSDGAWLELAIPHLPQASGWVSASLVSVNGDITDTPISQVPEAAPSAGTPASTVAPTEEPTVAPTATPTDEPTATPTLEPTATPTEPPTATPTLEPTATPTEEPTATPTREPTATPTEPPTATPTEEPTATPVPTEAPTEVPTEEPTATPAVIVLPTSTPRPQVQPIATEVPATEPPATEPPATEEPVVYAPPAAGFALVTAEPRLRVRSAPSTDGEIVGYAYPGEVFAVIGTNEDGTWTQIGGSAESAENPNGGWVATEFLLLGQ